MGKRLLTALLFLAAIFLLGACSASFDEAQKEAQAAVEEVFKEKAQETNKENEEIKYFLPSGATVVSEETSNVLLKNRGYEYRLFYNPLENEKSELVYNVTLEQRKYDVKKTWQDEERFGFLLISKLDDKTNEVVAGVGGVKVTAEIKTKDLAEAAPKMMEIAKSVQSK